MNVSIKNVLCRCQFNLTSRAFGCTPVAATKEWRWSQGLATNKNAEGILTDGPDYTYLDGRPTPLLHKQKKRMLQQQQFASRIVELNSELQFAKERHQRMIRESEEERQSIIDNRLKPKGAALLKKK